MSKLNSLFKKNDYVVCECDGEKYNAKVIEVRPTGYLIEICVDSIRNETRLMQEVEVQEQQLSPIRIQVKDN
jgi:hypothetical protein